MGRREAAVTDPALVPAGTPTTLARRLRMSGLLLTVGLLIEGGTLFALERPLGFLTFATVGGLLVMAGIALYLWTIVSQGSAK